MYIKSKLKHHASLVLILGMFGVGWGASREGNARTDVVRHPEGRVHSFDQISSGFCDPQICTG